MEKSIFKIFFGSIAKLHGFEYAFNGWFKESDECIIVLDLQKSQFGNYYDLNIKTYIQGVFGKRYEKSKYIVKNDMGDLFTRQPSEYNSAFDFDVPMDDELRKQKIEKLFSDFIVPTTNKTLTRAGIKEFAEKDKEFLLPAIKIELGL